MAIKQTTPEKDVTRYIEQKINRIEKLLVYNLSYVGEQAVNAARSTNSYKDRTGNLRSSIGYVVVMDGKIKTQSDFAPIKKGGEGSKGGKSYAKELVGNYPHGACLIVVAGMDYAVHVANKGYDVLDSAVLLAKKLVPIILAQLKFNSK